MGHPLGSQAFRLDVERLLCALVCETEAYPPHVTDGLIFRNEVYGLDCADMTGLAIYINDQRVDPFRIRLDFDLGRMRLRSGQAMIGFRGCPPAPYGSSAHNRMDNRLLADPLARHGWRDRYVGDAKGWRRLQN